MFSLAKETGWSEHFILWELPLARALAYQHAALRAHGVWTVPPKEAPAQELERLLTLLPEAEEDDE